jgi:hypothetical protein
MSVRCGATATHPHGVRAREEATMSIDLHNEAGESLHFSNRVFYHLLRLAHDYGWQPAGTQLPPLCVGCALQRIDLIEARVSRLKAAGGITEATALEATYRRWDAEHECYVSHLPEELAFACSCGERWRGWYVTNDGQLITAEDAQNLAAALERALPEIPEDRPHTFERDPDDPGVWVLKAGEELVERDYFWGEGKQWVRELIAFCRQGSVQIS